MNSTEHPVKVGLSDAFMALLSSQPSGQFPTQHLWFLHQTCRRLRASTWWVEDRAGRTDNWWYQVGRAGRQRPLWLMLSFICLSVLQTGNAVQSMSTIVSRLTPQRLLADLLSSSHLCLVSIHFTRLHVKAGTRCRALSPQKPCVCDSSACLQHTSCDLCLTSNLTTGCGWCNTLQR